MTAPKIPSPADVADLRAWATERGLSTLVDACDRAAAGRRGSVHAVNAALHSHGQLDAYADRLAAVLRAAHTEVDAVTAMLSARVSRWTRPIAGYVECPLTYAVSRALPGLSATAIASSYYEAVRDSARAERDAHYAGVAARDHADAIARSQPSTPWIPDQFED